LLSASIQRIFAMKGCQSNYRMISRNGRIGIVPLWILKSILTETARTS
jgi:hypothetical protein